MKNLTTIFRLAIAYVLIIYISSALFEWQFYVTEWSTHTQIMSALSFLPFGIIVAIQTLHGHEKQCENERTKRDCELHKA